MAYPLSFIGAVLFDLSLDQLYDIFELSKVGSVLADGYSVALYVPFLLEIRLTFCSLLA
jgi:hypothetical protein